TRRRYLNRPHGTIGPVMTSQSFRSMTCSLAGVLVMAVACSSPGQPSSATPALPAGAASLAPSDLGAFFDCLRTSGHAVVAAHRGGPTPGYAENAIETMAHVLSQAP